MANYCTRTDVEDTYGVANLVKWASLGGDASDVSGRIDRAIAAASAEIDDYFRASYYKLPLATATGAVPAGIRDIAATLAGVILYEALGVRNYGEDGQPGHSLMQQRTGAMTAIKEILTGVRRIDAMY